MSFSWSGNPATSTLDEVRFYCQDTDQGFPLLSDEEHSFLISRYLDIYGHPLAIAAIACEIIAARFTRQVDTSADGVSVSLGQLQQRYNDLAQSLRDQYREVGGSNMAATLDDMFSDVSMLEVEPLVFGVGFMDNYRAGQQDFGYYSPGETPWIWSGNPEDALSTYAMTLAADPPVTDEPE